MVDQVQMDLIVDDSAIHRIKVEFGYLEFVFLLPFKFSQFFEFRPRMGCFF